MTMKMVGSSELMKKDSTSPPSQRKKSTGPTPAVERTKSTSMPGDITTSPVKEPNSNKRKRTPSTSNDTGTGQKGSKKRAIEGQDQANGSAESPTTIPSASTTPPPSNQHGPKDTPGTLIEGSQQKDLPQNPGGKKGEDEVDYDDWLNDLEPFKSWPATDEERLPETAVEKEEVEEKPLEGVEVPLAGPEEVVDMEIDRELGEIADNSNIDYSLTNLHLDFIINNSDDANPYAEAERMAQLFRSYLDTLNINHVFMITRGGNLSLTCVKDLDGMLALGFGGEEVQAQLRLYRSQIADLEELVTKYNL